MGINLLDTNVIIFASKQLIDVERFVSSFASFYVSIITYIEVYGFDFKDENQKILIDELFKSIEIVEVNKIISEMKKIVGYEKTFTTAYNPSANPHSEKIHHFFRNAINSYIGPLQEDWDQYLWTISLT